MHANLQAAPAGHWNHVGVLLTLYATLTSIFSLFIFDVLGSNKGPTDRIQHIQKTLLFKAFDNRAPKVKQERWWMGANTARLMLQSKSKLRNMSDGYNRLPT